MLKNFLIYLIKSAIDTLFVTTATSFFHFHRIAENRKDGKILLANNYSSNKWIDCRIGNENAIFSDETLIRLPTHQLLNQK